METNKNSQIQQYKEILCDLTEERDQLEYYMCSLRRDGKPLSGEFTKIIRGYHVRVADINNEITLIKEELNRLNA